MCLVDQNKSKLKTLKGQLKFLFYRGIACDKASFKTNTNSTVPLLYNSNYVNLCYGKPFQSIDSQGSIRVFQALKVCKVINNFITSGITLTIQKNGVRKNIIFLKRE